MRTFIAHIKDKKKHYTIGLSIGIGVMAVASIAWLGIRKDAMQIVVDGQVIGCMTKTEAIEYVLTEAVETIEDTVGRPIQITADIELVPVNSKQVPPVEEAIVKKTFLEHVTYDVEAVEISVDGEVQAIVESKAVGQEVLEAIALMQLPEGSSVVIVEENIVPRQEVVEETDEDTEEHDIEEHDAEVYDETVHDAVLHDTEEVATLQSAQPVMQMLAAEGESVPMDEAHERDTEAHVLAVQIAEVERATQQTRADESVEHVQRDYKDFQFYETIVFNTVYTQEENIMTKEATTDMLLSNTDKVVKYVMEEGDNVWDIAVAYDTTMDRILEINPHITDVNRMQIGEEIKVAAPDPIVSIATTEVAIFNEITPAEIEYVEDDTLYKNEEVVQQEGKDGIKELTVSVDKVNGKEVSRTHLNEKVLQEPVTKIIGYGTKEKPKDTGGTSVTPSASGMFMNPLNGAGYVSSHYGTRWGTFHRGIDIAAPAGTPIYAAASGTVTYSGYNSGGFGNLVMIDHGNGYQTYYAHNSKNFVKVGQKVTKGQNIASVGSTGNSTGNHIHFEIRKNGNPINPYSYIY